MRPPHPARSLRGSRTGEQLHTGAGPSEPLGLGDSWSFLGGHQGPHREPSGAQQMVQLLKLSKLGNSQPPTYPWSLDLLSLSPQVFPPVKAIRRPGALDHTLGGPSLHQLPSPAGALSPPASGSLLGHTQPQHPRVAALQQGPSQVLVPSPYSPGPSALQRLCTLTALGRPRVRADRQTQLEAR